MDELIFMNFDPQADTITLDFALGQDPASTNSALVNGGGVTLVNASLDRRPMLSPRLIQCLCCEVPAAWAFRGQLPRQLLCSLRAFSWPGTAI